MIYSEKVIDQMEVQIAEQLSEIDNLKDRIAELEKQTKPLSDEEIEELQAEHTEKGHFADTLNVKNFARAILKKASEK